MNTSSMDKWVQRQKNWRRAIGIHMPCRPFGPGVSTAGSYFVIKGNKETAKRIHREMLEEMRVVHAHIRSWEKLK